MPRKELSDINNEQPVKGYMLKLVANAIYGEIDDLKDEQEKRRKWSSDWRKVAFSVVTSVITLVAITSVTALLVSQGWQVR